jgi:hypothetical protein
MFNAIQTPADRPATYADPNAVGFVSNSPALDRAAVATLERRYAMSASERAAENAPKEKVTFFGW